MRRAVIMFTAFLGALLFVLGSGITTAWAEGEALRGTLKSQNGPAAGVRISVTTAAGAAVGEATSDAAGKWAVPLEAGEGSYKVSLDPATLPEGVELRLKDRSTLTVQVFEGQERTVAFLLDTAKAAETARTADTSGAEWDRVAQLLFDGVNYGLIIALAALGLSLVFGTTGLTNFAHGELVSLGAILALAFNTLGLPLVLAGAVSVALCGLFGWFQDKWFWGWLRNRGVSVLVMMIISIGVAIFLRHLYLYFFGGGIRNYREFSSQPGWDLGPVSATPKSLVGIGIAIVVIIVVGCALLFTRMGKATRAVADNPALARSSGINVDLVIRLVWTLGAAIAGLAGVIFGLSFGVHYQMGFATLLLVFAGVTLGGLGTAFGALIGSLIVGLFIQLSTLVVPAEFKNAGALLILILVLLFRPQGVLGRSERIG